MMKLIHLFLFSSPGPLFDTKDSAEETGHQSTNQPATQPSIPPLQPRPDYYPDGSKQADRYKIYWRFYTGRFIFIFR